MVVQLLSTSENVRLHVATFHFRVPTSIRVISVLLGAFHRNLLLMPIFPKGLVCLLLRAVQEVLDDLEVGRLESLHLGI